jgi:hypothetical protein
MRCAGFDLDQLTKAVLADSTARRASSAVADAALQHGSFEAGLMTSKDDEVVSSLPSIHKGIVRLVPLVSDEGAIEERTFTTACRSK